MTTTFLKSISRLSKSELQEAKNKIDFCMLTASDKKQITDDALLNTIVAELKEKLKGFYFKYDDRTRIRAGEVQLYLDNYLIELLEINRTQKIVKKRFYFLYSQLVINDLLRWDKSPPLSVQIILNWQNKFAGLLERSFPGYIESGLFKLIFRKEN